MKKLFNENRTNIEKIIRLLENDNINNLNLENKNLVTNFLKTILEKNQAMFGFDQHCQYNIKTIGDSFLQAITTSAFDNNTYEEIIIFLIRIAREYELSTDISLPVNGRAFLEHYKNTSREYSDSLNEQIYFAWNIMPFKIHDQNNMKKFENVKENFKTDIEEILEKKLPAKHKEINDLRSFIENATEQLKSYKQKFSFVGLNKAFHDLSRSKNISKLIALLFLLLLAVIIIYIPYFYYEKTFMINEITKAFNLSLQGKDNLPFFILLSSFIPMFILESIFIYFFRIVLYKYNSLADQVVQLETKQAIIQFIESYVEYKKDKKLSKEELSKFENIVFSEISPNLKDMPNLPDIVLLAERITKIIKGK